MGGGILLVVVPLNVFAPWAAPHDPLEQDLLHMLTPSMWAAGGSGEFPLGTDGLGRCVLSRAIYDKGSTDERRSDPRATKDGSYGLFTLVDAMRLCSSISSATNAVTFGGRKRAAG